jgi:hypothetical protein
MTPMVHVPVEAAFKAGPKSAMSLTTPGRERINLELLEDNHRLKAENARLSEENDALRVAAAMWIRLYEKQLERANQATSATLLTQGTRG